MIDLIIDALIDVFKLIPFLFVAFLILEYIEHKMKKKNIDLLVNNRSVGPFLGGILGAFPQCGFSALATRLFSSRVITLGTLIGIYLSTSDEMLPLFISSGVAVPIIVKIILMKVVIGIFCGYIIDALYRRRENYAHEIKDMCKDGDCHCEKGIFYSSIHHTLHITIYLLITTLAINLLIYFVGEEAISSFLVNKKGFTYFLSSLIGLIPNCASSVIITELYVNNMLSLGGLMAGLLTASGVGLLILFKTNKNLKENILILGLIYLIGIIVGIVIDLVGVTI